MAQGWTGRVLALPGSRGLLSLVLMRVRVPCPALD